MSAPVITGWPAGAANARTLREAIATLDDDPEAALARPGVGAALAELLRLHAVRCETRRATDGLAVAVAHAVLGEQR